MLHRPRLLFLDEPTAGVDVRSRGLFWELIQEEAASGVTVFVTTHFLEEVDYCDWVSFIDAGRLIADVAPEELRRHYSEGYRIELAVPPEARAAVTERLAAGGLRAAAANGDLRITTPTLEPAALELLGRIVAEHPETRVHIEQPRMTEVFRRVLAEKAAPP
jgi:ABC-type multidrug transport system ATPase subunit